MQIITIDWETYYAKDYTLTKGKFQHTTEEYVRSPRFEVIGVAVKVGTQPAVWMEGADFRAWHPTVDWSRVAVLCQNTKFDGSILAWHFGVRPRLWLDTMSMAQALHPWTGASLKKLAPYYRVGEKGDEVDKVIGMRRRDFSAEAWLRYGEYSKQDAELTYAIAARMDFPRGELLQIDTTIRMFTEPKFVGNQAMLRKLYDDEVQRKADLLSRSETSKENLTSDKKFAALIVQYGETPPTKISPKTGKEGFAFAKTDPGFKALLEHERDEIRWLAEARMGTKSTIDESRAKRFLECAQRGPVPVPLKIYGAHTFRWSGADKLNMQNLRRGGVLRDSLQAPPGHLVVVVDSGQIEVRVNGWVSGHAAMLEAFRRNDAKTAAFNAAFTEAAGGRELSKEDEKAIAKELAARGIEEGDFYSDAGSAFFGRQLRKKDPERQTSKNMILGLGFQMGYRKFSLELLKGANGSPPVCFTQADADKLGVSVDVFRARYAGEVEKLVARVPFEALLVHCAVTKELVDRYRANNPITELWQFMAHEVLPAMTDGVEMSFANGVLRTVRHGIMLPSGLVMRYPGLERGDNGYSYMGGRFYKDRAKAYGGSMTENVVQALARVVVADQMLALRRKGYPIAAMTHDEVVMVVPEAKAEQCLNDALTEFRRAPLWAPDMPLNADGGIGPTYGSAK